MKSDLQTALGFAKFFYPEMILVDDCFLLKERALDNFKYEVATEHGVTLSGDHPSRENGRVVGQMTKRMIELAERQLQGGAAIPPGGVRI